MTKAPKVKRAKDPEFGYQVYTREHDVVVTARSIVENPADPFGPHAGYTKPNDPDGVPRPVPDLKKSGLATALQRAELIGALANDVADGKPLNGSAVTILVDQSGSQRGRHSPLVVGAVDQTVQAIEHLGASVEVLGFTTRRWKGGRAREKWMDSKRPPNPGRLGELLHIVYKEFGQSWDGTVNSPRHCLGLLYRDPYMKEGIDGEAVDWAASRLSRRSEKSKILIVLSDCAPIDDATLSVNGMTYLEIDLHRAISQAKKSGIEILAIDNHAIGRSKPQQYYDNVAYACAQDSMDPKDAALATARAVEAIVRPQPASALSP